MTRQIKTTTRHDPTLKTMLTIANYVYESITPISKDQLLKKMKNRVTRQTLNSMLNHLEKWGLVCETKYGFVWTFNPKKKRTSTRKVR